MSALETEPFDVLVVGGGIQGATIARAAAGRGLRVAVIDAADWGSGASANSLKIIHGGLRYLQHANLVRMRESIRARRRLLQLAPDTVVPLACIMPGRGWGLRHPAALLAALTANALLSADRNRGVPPGRFLPAGRLISRAGLESRVPAGRFRDETGGMVWHDAIAQDIDRLTLAFVQAAAARGAVAANYVRALRWRQEGTRIAGAEAVDALTGAPLEIRARQVVCAAGPGAGPLAPGTGAARWVKAINLVLKKKLVEDCALAIESKAASYDSQAVIQRGHRNFFVVPWQNGTLFGTFYVSYDPAQDPLAATESEIAEFVRQINETGFFAPLAMADVCRAHAGAQAAGAQATEPAANTKIVPAAPGLWIVQGVKYTTALETADEVADILAPRSVRPADEPFPWREAPADLDQLVAQAVREEMAVRLEDVVLRRSQLGAFGLPERATLARCAQAMAGLLGWDERRRAEEIDTLLAAHRRPGAAANG